MSLQVKILLEIDADIDGSFGGSSYEEMMPIFVKQIGDFIKRNYNWDNSDYKGFHIYEVLDNTLTHNKKYGIE